MVLIFLTVLLCAAFVYYVLFKPHRYWKGRSTFHDKPLPFFGSVAGIMFGKASIPDVYLKIYNKYPNERYIPYYQFLAPALMIRDPELIKQIAVKDFDSFPEHNDFISRDADPLWSKTLSALPGGQEWKDIRHVLTPAFTSNKLKGMFGLMTTCAEQFVEYFEALGGDQVSMEMKDAFNRVTNDIIATTAFGVACNSMATNENEIFRMGRDIFQGDPLMNMKFFAGSIHPKLGKYLKITFVRQKFADFFRKIIKETIEVRERKNIVRPDMIHLLMEARKGKLRHEEVEVDSGCPTAHEPDSDPNGKRRRARLTDDVITSQALVFYLAGFDGTARAMCFTAYELALHPHIQQRLRSEVDETLERCGGKITYEALMEMKYLDMVLSESLRKWPPFAITDRKPVKNFTIEPTNEHERPFLIETDIVLQFPIFPIHRDPKFYPDPMKFDPERFSEENKHKIKPFTFIPFGAGPRNCIGLRFAMLEVKTIIFYLLSKFEVVPVERTSVPLVLGRKNINPDPDDGFWLGVKRRR